MKPMRAGGVVLRSFLASACNAFEALELTDREDFCEERWFIDGDLNGMTGQMPRYHVGPDLHGPGTDFGVIHDHVTTPVVSQ